MVDNPDLYIKLGELVAEVRHLQEEVKALDSKVDVLNTLKHRGIGILIGVGIVASAIGSAITWLFGKP